jgi:hypothetical protein
VAERYIFCDGENRDQHEVLVNHSDTGTHGVSGAGEVNHRVINEDLALFCLVQAIENIHQR